MRILITTESRGANGGIETYLKALSPSLVAEGHELGWLFGDLNTGGPSVAGDDCKRIWTTSSERKIQTRSEIERWRPDAIYANGLHDPHWDYWLAQRFPTTYFAHGFFGACISGRKCHAAAGIEVCQRTLGPACLMLYLPRRCGGRSPFRMFRDYRRERQRQRNLQLFRAVLVASSYMEDEYRRQGVAGDRLHILPLFPTGITPASTSPERRLTWTNRVLMVGRLTELKGTSLVVEGVSIASKILNRRLTLVVVGEGPGKSIIERDASNYNVPIELHGWQGAKTRNAFMRNADVLLVPSLWPEPFGLVGIEAGCIGLPAVAFDVGGIRDWLRSGFSGELVKVPPPSAEKLGEGLATVLSNSERYQTLRLGAWTVSQQYQIESHVNQLASILRNDSSEI